MNCSRKLLFENDNEEHPITGQGSGFLAYHNENLYFLTTKHAMGNYQPEQLMILYHPEKNDCIPILDICSPKQTEGVNEKCMDFVICSLEEEADKESLYSDFRPYTIKDSQINGTPPSQGCFVLNGFSNRKSNIDPESKHIFQQSIAIVGDATGRSRMKNCHEVKIRDTSNIEDIGGMSGSPLFWLDGISAPNNHFLSGMLIEQQVDTTLVHYIESEVIIAFLKLIEKNIYG